MKDLGKVIKKEKIFNLRILDVWKINQQNEGKKDKDKYISLSEIIKFCPVDSLEN